MKLKQLTMEWSFIRPLLLCSAALVDPLHPLVMKIDALKKEKKKKKSQDVTGLIREIDMLQWKAGAYWNDELGFYIPSDTIEAVVKNGAQLSRLGKKVEAAVVCADGYEQIPIILPDGYKKPATLDEAHAMGDHKDGGFILRSPVRIPPKTGARVMMDRVMLPTGSKIKVKLDFDDEFVAEKDLFQACQDAGLRCGLGAWRPKFGKFTVK